MVAKLHNSKDIFKCSIEFKLVLKFKKGIECTIYLFKKYALSFTAFSDILLLENKASLSNYAGDNILYASGSYMCLRNTAVCVYEKDTINDILKFGDDDLEASTLETVFGIEINGNLNFED